jgi:hypothetical protein
MIRVRVGVSDEVRIKDRVRVRVTVGVRVRVRVRVRVKCGIVFELEDRKMSVTLVTGPKTINHDRQMPRQGL